MAAPYEIVAAPYTIYLAAVGTAFPNVDTAPSGSWTKLGTSGTKNYSEDGVSVTHSQTIDKFTPVGGTGARKAWRTAESMTIEFTLVDLSTEQYAKILNDATVTTVASSTGIPGTKSFNTQQGTTVALFALLARGVSTVSDTLAAQYQVAMCYQAGNPAPVYKKGQPAGLACQFDVLEDATLGFGKWINQTAAAS